MRLRSKCLAVVPVVIIIASFTDQSAYGFDHGRPRWDVAVDFRLAPNQTNPSPDQMGHAAVWSYLYSPSGKLNPGDYQLLPHFDTDKFDIQGLESWWGQNVSTNDDDRLPAVGINATGHEVSPFNVFWPAGAILVHPWNDQPVIIGWRSPVSGHVFVTGAVSLAQQPNCGSGIAWAFDQGMTDLAHGTIQQQQTNSWSLRVHVVRGQGLYLSVSPRVGIACDSTLVDLTIMRGQQ